MNPPLSAEIPSFSPALPSGILRGVNVRPRRSYGWLHPLAAVCALMLSSTGCYKATFIADARAPTVEPTHEEWDDFFLFGTTGEAKHDVRAYCAGGAAVVRTGGNFATGLVSVVTIGIYTPRKTYFTCNPAPPYGGTVPAPPVPSGEGTGAPQGEGGAP
jgi:hypothetical protein